MRRSVRAVTLAPVPLSFRKGTPAVRPVRKATGLALPRSRDGRVVEEGVSGRRRPGHLTAGGKLLLCTATLS